MRFTSLRRPFITLRVIMTGIFVLAAAFASAAPKKQTKEVTFSHQTHVQSPAGKVSLARGDVLNIRIQRTIEQCYTYNLSIIPREEVVPEGGRLRPTDEVLIPVEHDGEAAGYKVSIRTRKGFENRPECGDETEVEIPVETLAWGLGFAGGFTADRIPNPVYFLEEGKKGDTAGFFVRQNRSAESRAALGTGAFIHLFHSDPDRYSLGGFGNWAPVSFGLAVGNDAETKYFIGTSIRFDQHLYLSTGVALGPSTRLPDSLDLRDHNFTTASTALDNAPKRTAAGWYIGLSYTFLGRDLANTFSAPFVAPPPEGGVTPAEGGEGGGGNEDAAPAITSANPPPETGQKAGQIIVLTGTGFTPAVGSVKAQIATPTKNFPAEIQSGSTATSLSIKIPADFPAGDAIITVTAGEATSKQFKYKVLAP